MTGTCLSSRILTSLCWLSLGGLAAVGALLLPAADERNTRAHQSAAPQDAAIQTATPKKQAFRREIMLPGVLKAFEEVSVQSRVAGFIETVYVDIGDKVKKGDVLAKIFAPELAEDVKIKKARVSQREAELKQARIGVTVAEAVTEVSEAQRNEAVAALEKAEAMYVRWDKEVKRNKELQEKNVIDKQTVEQSISQLNAAAATINEAKAKVATFQGTLKMNRASREKAALAVEAAQAALEVAKAEYQERQIWFEYTTLRAPFDGVVVNRMAHPGQFVQPPNAAKDKEPAGLLDIIRMDTMRLSVLVSEKDASSLKVGTKAIARMLALDNREFSCQISRIASQLDEKTSTLRVEMLLPNPKGELLPGMFAHVRIQLEEVEAFTLPADAILADGPVKYCFLIENGKATRHNLKVGSTSDGQIEIMAKQVPSTKAGEQPTWQPIGGTERAILFDLSSIEASKSKPKP